jgi:hypothetical protein
MWVSTDVQIEMKQARWFGYKPQNNAAWQAAKQRNFMQFKTVGAGGQAPPPQPPAAAAAAP